ncbi:MAG: DUF1036 domain-containing protein [Cyanobacteria bacterium MAG CAR1_bin_15]|nr:DUF1036 domain-containing protein [Cyanobacteria bacterium MAG CAR1_bin_15]
MKDFPLLCQFSVQFLPFFAALLGCGLILGFAEPAEARMRFCNQTDQKLDVSWAWKHINGDWVSEGHYRYEPGECDNVYSFPLRSRIYYYYAEDKDGNTTHGASNKTNREFCVSSGPPYEIVHDGTSVPYYNKYHKAGGWKQTCSGLGDETNATYRLEEFRQVNTGSLGFRCTVYLKPNGRSNYNC